MLSSDSVKRVIFSRQCHVRKPIRSKNPQLKFGKYLHLYGYECDLQRETPRAPWLHGLPRGNTNGCIYAFAFGKNISQLQRLANNGNVCHPNPYSRNSHNAAFIFIVICSRMINGFKAATNRNNLVWTDLNNCQNDTTVTGWRAWWFCRFCDPDRPYVLKIIWK